MADTKKLWFCGRDGLDGGAWADLWTLKQVRDFFKGNEAVEPHLPKKAFKTLRVKRCFGQDGDDSRLFVWGETQPGFQNGDLQAHVGTYVEVDGKVIFDDIVEEEEEDEDE